MGLLRRGGGRSTVKELAAAKYRVLLRRGHGARELHQVGVGLGPGTQVISLSSNDCCAPVTGEIAQPAAGRPRRPAYPRDNRRALPRTRRRTGVSARPAEFGPGAAVAAALTARVKASIFSCHIRLYSRRSRARGGHPPVSIRVARYPITSGAVQAISHICIQDAIQSVADGARVTGRELAISRA